MNQYECMREIEYYNESEIVDTKEIQLKIKELESEIKRLKNE